MFIAATEKVQLTEILRPYIPVHLDCRRSFTYSQRKITPACIALSVTHKQKPPTPPKSRSPAFAVGYLKLYLHPHSPSYQPLSQRRPDEPFEAVAATPALSEPSSRPLRPHCYFRRWLSVTLCLPWWD